MAATIQDVARLAGCSIKTVSRVINHEPHVSAGVQARVQAAIRSAGYAPNISARRLARQKSGAVCILLYPGFAQPAPALLPQVLDIGYEENHEIVFQTFYPNQAHSRNRLVELVNERRYDGFITTPPADADEFAADLLGTYKVPLVQVNPLNRSTPIPFVAGDDQAGAIAMTGHLIGLGHKRIAFLMGPRNMRSAFDRLHGYQSALMAGGLDVDPSLTLDSEFNFDGGYWAARLLLERPDPPTAIYAGSDEAAFGVLYAARELSLVVPQDLSVGGHDDLLFARAVYPGLTTVHQPGEAIVVEAVRLLLAILKDTQPARTQVTLPAQLVLRGTTAPPRPSR